MSFSSRAAPEEAGILAPLPPAAEAGPGAVPSNAAGRQRTDEAIHGQKEIAAAADEARAGPLTLFLSSKSTCITFLCPNTSLHCWQYSCDRNMPVNFLALRGVR